jgi:hypothetical protein
VALFRAVSAWAAGEAATGDLLCPAFGASEIKVTNVTILKITDFGKIYLADSANSSLILQVLKAVIIADLRLTPLETGMFSA